MTASFARNLEQFGEAIALILESGETVSYAELARHADEAASRLPARRSLLALEMRRDLASVATYLAALRTGHPVILLESLGSEAGRNIVESWNAWVVGAPEPQGEQALHPDLAVLMSTSGTTGSAKLVRLSHANIAANARSIVEYLAIGPADRAITSLPLYYSYGLSILHSHLEAGACVMLTEESAANPAFWEFFERHGATSIAGVPFTYEIFERLDIRHRPLPSLKTLTQAGGRLPPEQVRSYADWAEARGVRFFVMYGQTEAVARMAYLPPHLAATHSDCIGKAIPGGSFSLVYAGDPARPGVGELVYRGPNVMMGYAVAPADLARGPELEALHTGDLAELTADGLYRIVGRLSRFSKLFGLRISHDEVEKFLAAQQVKAVVTGDDTAICILFTGSAPENLPALLSERFGLPETSFALLAAEHIPRLPSGKTDYVAVRTLFSRQSAPADARSVDQIFAQSFPRTPIAETDSFVALGGDSLSYVNFSVALEKLLGFTPDDWERLTLAELRQLKPKEQPGRSRFFTRTDSDIFVRAAAILGVVLLHTNINGHAELDLAAAGGASVLMVLFGYNLARFQLSGLLSTGRWKVVGDFAVRIILPYYLLLIAYTVVKQDFNLPAFLMVSNYFGRFGSTMEPFWFLEATIQCLIFLVLLFSLPAARALQERSPKLFALTLVALALLLKYLGGLLLDQQHLLQRTFDATLCYVALGWAAAISRDRAWRLGVYALCVGVTVWSWGWNDTHLPWMAVGMLLVLFVPRIALPRLLAPAVVVIASASFYIYLTHSFVIYGMEHVLGVNIPLLTTALAVVTGIFCGRARDAAMTRLG